MKNNKPYKFLLAFLAVTATGCAGPVGTGVGPSGASTMAGAGSMTTVNGGAHVAPMTVEKQYAGQYNGTITWSVADEAATSSLKTNLHFHNKNILAPFIFTFANAKHNYRFYGRVKSKANHSMYIAFLIYNAKKGGYATGNGTIANGTFFGGAKLEDGTGYLRFNVTKQ